MRKKATLRIVRQCHYAVKRSKYRRFIWLQINAIRMDLHTSFAPFPNAEQLLFRGCEKRASESRKLSSVAQHVGMRLAHRSDLGFDLRDAGPGAEPLKSIAPDSAAAVLADGREAKGLFAVAALLRRNRTHARGHSGIEQNFCHLRTFHPAIGEHVIRAEIRARCEAHGIRDGHSRPTAEVHEGAQTGGVVGRESMGAAAVKGQRVQQLRILVVGEITAPVAGLHPHPFGEDGQLGQITAAHAPAEKTRGDGAPQFGRSSGSKTR